MWGLRIYLKKFISFLYFIHFFTQSFRAYKPLNEIRGKRVSAFKSDLISFAYVWLKYVRGSGNIACPGDSVPHARFFRVRPGEIIASHFIPDKEQHAPPVRVPIHSIGFYGSFVHDEGSCVAFSIGRGLDFTARSTHRSKYRRRAGTRRS